MSYKENDVVYHACPFVFTIEQLRIAMLVKEDDGIYYIESNGAYLKEANLFRTLDEAKQNAMNKLAKFYHEKKHEIIRSKPTLNEEK